MAHVSDAEHAEGQIRRVDMFNETRQSLFQPVFTRSPKTRVANQAEFAQDGNPEGDKRVEEEQTNVTTVEGSPKKAQR